MTSPAAPSLPLTGGCNCGAVRFEVSEPFVTAVYCHCSRCQRRTGSGASANGRTVPGSFRIVRGQDRVQAWKPETGAAKYFCADCGSALFSATSDDPPAIGVRLGAIDGDPGIRPSARQFVTYAAAWEEIPDDGLPRYPESQGAGLAPPGGGA